MKIIRRKEVIIKDFCKETRYYYLPDNIPFVVIETVLKPGDIQPTHGHKVIREATLVLEGKIRIIEKKGNLKKQDVLNTGDFVVLDNLKFHTMINSYSKVARTLTFKFLGTEKDVKLFAEDKIFEK